MGYWIAGAVIVVAAVALFVSEWRWRKRRPDIGPTFDAIDLASEEFRRTHKEGEKS